MKSYTLKIRGGVDRDCYGKKAGKGALIQTELSGTLGVSQDQYLFTPLNRESSHESVDITTKMCAELSAPKQETIKCP